MGEGSAHKRRRGVSSGLPTIGSVGQVPRLVSRDCLQ